jgi:hypothetical protein
MIKRQFLEQPDHLSYSGIDEYMDCGHRWKLSHLCKKRSLRGLNLVTGYAVHAIIEEHLLHPETPLTDEWVRSTISKSIGNPQTINWGEESIGSLTTDILRLVDPVIHPPYIMKDYPFVRAEVKFGLLIPGVSIPIIGRIDGILADGTMVDIKTSAYPWKMDRAAKEIQPLFYLAAYEPRDVKHVFTHLVIVKAKTPYLQALTVEHSQEEVDWMAEVIQQVWKAMSRSYFPKNPASPWCSVAGCPFYYECRGRF